MAVSTTVKSLKVAWNNLNGVACIYKPAGLSCRQVRHSLITNICRDINQLEPTTPRTFVKIEPVEVFNNNDQLIPYEPHYQVVKTQNLTDLELVRGPAITHEDVRFRWANSLGPKVSGVMVVGVNRGNKIIENLVTSRPLSVYQIKGQLGIATDNYWADGKVFEKSTSLHIKRSKLDGVLSSVQASNQRLMFEYCGVDPLSQTGYELATQGLLRPGIKSPPLIYSIKCIQFEAPVFTLEIHCINETENYLSTLIHDLGITLKSTAVCLQMRCIRYGYFNVENSLLRKHWSLEYLYEHMALQDQIIAKASKVTPKIDSPQSSMLNQ